MANVLLLMDGVSSVCTDIPFPHSSQCKGRKDYYKDHHLPMDLQTPSENVRKRLPISKSSGAFGANQKNSNLQW